jgi:hypothetical protein
VQAPNPLLRRLALYASLAAGLFGAIVALFACVVATVAGHAPSPGEFAAIVAGTGLAFALMARFLIGRIPWIGLATYAARRISARRAGRKGPPRP